MTNKEHISIQAAAERLAAVDDIIVLTHKNPDGDTIGSALAITAALRQIGKRCRAVWEGELRARYNPLTEGYTDEQFEPKFVLAVDTAGEHLLPDAVRAEFGGRVDLAIDHHGTNTGYAALTVVNAEASCCCEIILAVMEAFGAELTPYIGSCLYVGLATDTGCFKFSNTTPASHQLAARLAHAGVDIAYLNDLFFERKSRSRVELERRVLAGMEFTSRGRICIITVTREMLLQTGCNESDLEDLSGLPRSIEGVECGITLREQENGNFKISVRTKELDAAAICASFGGGGHLRAAGCECSGTPFDLKVALVARVERALAEAAAEKTE